MILNPFIQLPMYIMIYCPFAKFSSDRIHFLQLPGKLIFCQSPSTNMDFLAVSDLNDELTVYFNL